jgi:hypothetical protein
MLTDDFWKSDRHVAMYYYHYEGIAGLQKLKQEWLKEGIRFFNRIRETFSMPDQPPKPDDIPSYEDVQSALGDDLMSFMSEMLSEPKNSEEEELAVCRWLLVCDQRCTGDAVGDFLLYGLVGARCAVCDRDCGVIRCYRCPISLA